MGICKKFVFATCVAAVGVLAGHGETFREKLDAYFAEHAQEIQKSIQAWDNYNLNKPEYRITVQKLKDVVMYWYKEAVDMMCLSMRHKIRFFDYYRAYLREDNVASLRKRFDCEQIRIHALWDLGDMIEKFSGKGIYDPNLTKYYNACASYAIDPEYPGGLGDYLSRTFRANLFFNLYEKSKYTPKGEYAFARLVRFFNRILFDGHSLLPHWIDGLNSNTVLMDFYWQYAKYHPARLHEDDSGLELSISIDSDSDEGDCFYEHCDAILMMFKGHLLRSYEAVMNLLPKSIETACKSYRIYKDTLAELGAEKTGSSKKIRNGVREFGKAIGGCSCIGMFPVPKFTIYWKHILSLKRSGTVWMRFRNP